LSPPVPVVAHPERVRSAIATAAKRYLADMTLSPLSVTAQPFRARARIFPKPPPQATVASTYSTQLPQRYRRLAISRFTLGPMGLCGGRGTNSFPSRGPPGGGIETVDDGVYRLTIVSDRAFSGVRGGRTAFPVAARAASMCLRMDGRKHSWTPSGRVARRRV